MSGKMKYYAVMILVIMVVMAVVYRTSFGRKYVLGAAA